MFTTPNCQAVFQSGYTVLFPTVHENSICIFFSLSLCFAILFATLMHILWQLTVFYYFSLMTAYVGFLIRGSQQGSHRSCLGLLDPAVTGVKGGLSSQEPGGTWCHRSQLAQWSWQAPRRGGPRLLSLRGVIQGCTSQTDGKGRSGMYSEGRCCFTPLFPRGMGLSLCWTAESWGKGLGGLVPRTSPGAKGHRSPTWSCWSWQVQGETGA